MVNVEDFKLHYNRWSQQQVMVCPECPVGTSGAADLEAQCSNQHMQHLGTANMIAADHVSRWHPHVEPGADPVPF